MPRKGLCKALSLLSYEIPLFHQIRNRFLKIFFPVYTGTSERTFIQGCANLTSLFRLHVHICVILCLLRIDVSGITTVLRRQNIQLKLLARLMM